MFALCTLAVQRGGANDAYNPHIRDEQEMIMRIPDPRM